MSDLPVTDASTRRDFIAGLTVGAAGLMATACASGAKAQTAPASVPGPASYVETTRGNFTMLRPAAWDDSWTSRLGKYRTVFDVSDLNDDPASYQVVPIMDNYKEALGVSDADLGFVLIIRHAAMAMAVNDAMWDKYNLRSELKRQDGDADAPPAPAKGSPFSRTIAECQKRGVTILGCNVAMNGFANRTARKAGGDAKAIKADLFANIWPGMILQPTGVYALARAQNVGCGYMT
jgi:hypothetical protein